MTISTEQAWRQRRAHRAKMNQWRKDVALGGARYGCHLIEWPRAFLSIVRDSCCPTCRQENVHTGYLPICLRPHGRRR
jgi:hypothetical protein